MVIFFVDIFMNQVILEARLLIDSGFWAVKNNDKYTAL